MKVVLDTNVLVSGILFMGPPHRILLAWSDGRFELVFTSDIHEEYRRVAAELQQQFPRVDLAAVPPLGCGVFRGLPNSHHVLGL